MEWDCANEAERSKITPTKRFEKIYQSAVLSVLKQYSPLYEEGMADEELLTAHGILTYAQTLEFKGAVAYQIDDGPVINTAARNMEPCSTDRHWKMRYR
ncbi:MAG: hypothetical protein V8S36_02230 [Lachnospiraceae bacterium]